MHLPSVFRSTWRGAPALVPLLVLWILAPGKETARADEGGGKPGRRAAAAHCASETASVLRRESPEKPWKVVTRNEALPAGNLLLLIGTDAALDSANGAVRLAGMGEMPGVSGFPVLETAVVLHDGSDTDLDFTLDRGRVVLSNRKPAGAAHVRVHIRDRAADLVLNEPGAAVALEIYGRWPKGVPFAKDPKPGDEPALAIVVLALKGEVDIKGKLKHFALKAPPGPALLMGDSLQQVDPTPQYMDKLPDWAGEKGRAEREKRRAMAARFRRLVVERSLGEALDEFLKSDDEHERRVAVYLMGALDDLERLAAALMHAKHPDVWDAGVLALRHWIGRGPGQDQKLYRALVEKKKFPPAQAETVLTLLHSFGGDDLARPETYEMLIDYLGSDRLAIRGLAGWHLYRLVPAGRKFGYNPLAPQEERARAIREWKKLVPSGKLPPKS
jgi:hypothetical protein